MRALCTIYEGRRLLRSWTLLHTKAVRRVKGNVPLIRLGGFSPGRSWLKGFPKPYPVGPPPPGP